MFNSASVYYKYEFYRLNNIASYISNLYYIDVWYSPISVYVWFNILILLFNRSNTKYQQGHVRFNIFN